MPADTSQYKPLWMLTNRQDIPEKRNTATEKKKEGKTLIAGLLLEVDKTL